MGLSIKPPLIYQLFLLVMVAGKVFFWPESAQIFHSFLIAALCGFPLLARGTLLALEAKKIFQQSGTPMMGPPVDPKKGHLHTMGAFSWTRNPMYLGISVALVGAAIMTNCWWHLLLPYGNALIMNICYIPKEEKDLQTAYGEKYVIYKKKVRRWV